MAATIEFLIARRDEIEEHRWKQGDIIGAHLSPHAWGTKELLHYLVVPATGISFDNARKLAVELLENEDFLISRRIAKRKYKIPLEIIKDGWYPEMSIPLISDKTFGDQPLKANNIVIDFSEHVSICFDKQKNSFKYLTKKVK